MPDAFPLPVTALYAALCAFILVFLAFKVIAYRRKNRVVLGDADSPIMARYIRGHSNAAEWMPMTLILMGLAEGLGLPTLFLHVLGICFVVGRGLHAHHFTQEDAPLSSRSYGMMLTIAVTNLLAISIIVTLLLRLF